MPRWCRAVMAGTAAFGLGCTTLEVNVELGTCEDINLQDPPDPALFIEPAGVDALVFVQPRFAGDADAFAPDFEFHGHTFFVRERWHRSEDSGNELCVRPTVRMVEPATAHWEVEWYDGDDSVPLFHEEFDL